MFGYDSYHSILGDFFAPLEFDLLDRKTRKVMQKSEEQSSGAGLKYLTLSDYTVKDYPSKRVIQLNVAGCSKKDMEVTLEGRLLSVKGIVPDSDRRYAYEIKVAPKVSMKDIKAKCKNGLMEVTIMKPDEESTTETITVE